MAGNTIYAVNVIFSLIIVIDIVYVILLLINKKASKHMKQVDSSSVHALSTIKIVAN
jgi:hypothetical protein